MYSTINRTKFGKCAACGKDNTKVIKVAKETYCIYCRNTQKKKVKLEKAKEKQKVRSLKNTTQNLENKENSDLIVFFRNAEAEVAKHPYCMECGCWIPKDYYHSAVAHIFMKSIFKSVAAHPVNYLILSAGCGCHDKTHTLSDFAKMKVFPIAVERFKQFESQIMERHKYLNEFRDYASRINKTETDKNRENESDLTTCNLP